MSRYQYSLSDIEFAHKMRAKGIYWKHIAAGLGCSRKGIAAAYKQWLAGEYSPRVVGGKHPTLSAKFISWSNEIARRAMK